MSIDGWIRLRGWGRIGVLVGMLRRLLDGALYERFANLGKGGADEGGGGGGGYVGIGGGDKEREVVDIVRRLVEGGWR
ncbi:hypothetical protein BDZ91DRAFT_712998 [Kalaharituber pfeilii]|nr:hypothetical protein BDZ91DRAFT_712998 [Kalaharituber pfeilii]